MGGEIMGPKIFPKLDGINPLSQDKHSLIKNILFEHHKLNEIDEIKKMFNPEYLNNQNLLESFEESIKNLNKISDDNLPNFCASWLYNQETLKYTSFCNIRFRNLYKYSLPFLDNDVIDFMLKVPSKFRIEKKLYKSMLIKNYSDLFSLPTKNTYGLKLTTNDLALYIKIFLESFQKRINRISSFLIRKNVFFIKSHNYIDYDDLLRTNKEYQNFMREKINNVLSREYFNKDSIEKIWKLHIDGRKNYAMLIGLLVTFEIFLENYTTN